MCDITDKEFEETYEFLQKIKFYKMHVFKYSPRKGTKAAVMPNQINGDIKEERSKKLIELSDRNEIEYNKSYIGKNVEVLIEDISFDGKYLIGRTSQDVPEEDGIIYVENNNFESKVNSFVNVKVTEVKEYDLIGKIV